MDLIAAIPSDSYTSFFLSRPFWDVLHLFLLGLARITPIVALAPFFGGKTLPDPMKLGFSITIVTIFLPFLIVNANPAEPLNLDLNFMLLLIKEVLIGSIIGFFISMPFFYTQAAGTLIDHQRGAQSLQVTDPTLQIQASPIGLLYNRVMIVVFFFIGGPFLFLEGVYASYQLIPADKFLNAAFFSEEAPLFNNILKYASTLVTMMAQFSAPALLAILLSDLFLGICNRMAPQVQISFLLWSLKAFVGILFLWAAWWLVMKQMSIEGLAWTKLVNKLIQSFA